MSARTRIVKLVDLPSWPKHGIPPTDCQKKRTGTWKKWRGKRISIYAYPMTPASTWGCGTKWVWEVAEKTVKAIYKTYDRPFYVCEHQVVFLKRRKP